MKPILLAVVSAALIVDTVHAQDVGLLVSEVKRMHDTLRGDVVQSAEAMPSEYFDFRPTPDVRTFGSLVGHVATTLYDYCSVAGDRDNPNQGLVEETVDGKADLVEALKGAYTYCEEALVALDDKTGLETVSAWREGTRLSFLVAETGHTSLHYGNMVTYLRLKGIVPASTARRGW